MARKEIPRELSIYINDKAVVNSLRGITGEISRTNNEMRNLNRNSATYTEDMAQLRGNLANLTERQSEFRNEIRNTSEAMDDSSGSFAKFRDGLLSGDLESAKEGLSGIKAELTGLVKTSLAFIATPIGAAIAVLAGFAAGAKAIFDFNQQAEKSAVLIENLSGKTGQVVEDIRIKMQAMTDTFEIGFDQLAGAVDNLVDTGVAKDELEALERIKNGLLTAPDKNEFIASLESSALTAKQVGLSLEEVIALKKQIEEKGVDPEATFGALQKASQKLALQSDSLRTSLTNAFGASFTDDVLAKIKTGQLTTVQALDLIGKKSKEVGLNQTEQAKLSTELFGKAGLAAGGFAVIVDTVTGGLKKQKEELNGNQKALLELSNANEKLQKAQSELLRVRDFGELWTKIKANAIDALASVITYIADLKADIQPLIDIIGVVLVGAWINLKFIVVSSFDVIGAVVKGFFDYLKFSFNFIKAIITGDFKGAINLLKNYFISLGDSVGNIFAKIKNNIINAIQGIVSNISPVLSALGIDVEKLQKRLESFKSKEIIVKTKTQSGSDGNNPEPGNTKILAEELAKQKALRDAARQKEADARKTAADKKKAEQDKADKLELDKFLALAKAKGDLAKAELAYFISNNASKLDLTKKLTPELIAEETSRLDTIKDKQLMALAEERLSKVEKAQADAKSAQELVALKQTIDYDYETNRQNLELGFLSATDALKKQYTEEQKVLAAEQLLAANDLALAEADTKEEADALKRQFANQKELDGYKKLLTDKAITQDQYDRFIAAAKVKQDDVDRMSRAAHLSQNLQALGSVAGALGEMFGQSKALAIVQAGINGALAITNIFATTPKVDFGFSTYALIAASAISTVAAIAKITSAKAPAKPKFFHGGDTGNYAALGYDEYGPMTGIVHDGEYVVPKAMRQNPRYANTIAWLESERTGKRTRKFAQGGDVSTNTIPDPVMTENDSEMKSLLRAVLFRLENPIPPKINFGYQDAKEVQNLNDERNQSISNGIISE
ncbi:hypothetical protein [Flavobacterium urumqiense]|uniref:Uncharacterized protein n=1 Tax=Flavobacterium urumqiense TaxID=935224 RepID=A0A1H5Z6P0_9FLAO|nr:hypothetical protein [Flavobacterium urumqiense]SEG31991.1 hypothetical protein SAMN04488130_109135 [Flavobacterium urumqiense]